MLQKQTLLLQRKGWLLRLHVCPLCHETAQHELPWVRACINALKEITHTGLLPMTLLCSNKQTFHPKSRATGPAVQTSCFDLQKEMGVNGARKSCFTWNSNKQFVSHKRKTTDYMDPSAATIQMYAVKCKLAAKWTKN